MEKLRREIKELAESNARLGVLIDYLVDEKNLMASKSNHIFMLDMQDYVAALKRLAPSDSENSATPPDIKQINHLLTQQYELMKLIQRDYARLELQDKLPEEMKFDNRKKKHFRRLQVINQLLLQDNIFFQSMLDTNKISGNIRIGERKNWLQRLLSSILGLMPFFVMPKKFHRRTVVPLTKELKSNCSLLFEMI